MRLGASAVYGLCEWLLYLLTVCLIVFTIAVKEPVMSVGVSIAYGFIAILFARIICIARLEIENIKEREMLNTIFSATMAFIGVVIAVIALIVQLA